METNEEYWDLYNRQGKYVKRYLKGTTILGPTLYHKCVEIIPFDRKGFMLITQRAYSKRFEPGKYEFPAGSVISGETEQQAALRELLEETGLRPKKLYPLCKDIYAAPMRNYIPGMIRYIYLAEIPDLTKQQIRLQQGETISYRFCTFADWMQLISQEMFSGQRSRLYPKAMYTVVENIVGVPESKPHAEKPAPAALKPSCGLVRNPRNEYKPKYDPKLQQGGEDE